MLQIRSRYTRFCSLTVVGWCEDKYPIPTFRPEASQSRLREAAIAAWSIMLSVTAREEMLCIENRR